MSNPAVARILQASLVVMNLVIGATILEIGRGTIPIPDDLKWVVPIMLAALNGISLFLPRFGSERLAQQVDALKSQGVDRADMVVVSRDWPPGVPHGAEALAKQIVAQIKEEMSAPPVEPDRVRVVPGGRG